MPGPDPAVVDESRRNLVYAELPGTQLLLDLYRPVTERAVPVVLFFHSGGWRSGTKDDCKVRWLTRYGFAVASVSYRLLPRHRFPVQVQDAKAAVRFLRGHSAELGLHPEQVVASGLSAGAYLACMLGLTAGHPDLEPPPTGPVVRADDPYPHPGLPQRVEPAPDAPTHVNAVVNFAGFTDLVVLQKLPSRRGERAGRSPEARLLGHAVHDDLGRARLANPIDHVHPDAPPFLHVHGELNEVTPLDQTRRFHAALQAAGVTSKVVLVRGSGHNSRRLFDTPSIRDRVADYLHRHLDTDGVRVVQQEMRPRDAG
ncbi:MAG: alpha/beta hydrolase [Planctomycetota bacterium]